MNAKFFAQMQLFISRYEIIPSPAWSLEPEDLLGISAKRPLC